MYRASWLELTKTLSLSINRSSIPPTSIGNFGNNSLCTFIYATEQIISQSKAKANAVCYTLKFSLLVTLIH